MTPLGACRPCDGSLTGACGPGVRHNALSRVFCREGEYNDLATLVAAPAGVPALHIVDFDVERGFLLHNAHLRLADLCISVSAT